MIQLTRSLPVLVASLFILSCGGGSSSTPTQPSASPTAEPTTEPTQQPTQTPTQEPTVEPTNEPTIAPTIVPTTPPTGEPVAGRFSNPLFANGADPWLQWYQGNYYLTTTTWSSQLVMRKSPTIAGLSTATPQYIWSDTHAERGFNFWAFEFHRLEGPNGARWYVMYTAGHEANLDGQKLHVLESAGDDPLGPYEFKSTLMPNRWNIDGSYFKLENQLYLLWSEWVGADQSTWIAKMDNPWTVDESTAVVITKPELDWEFGLDLDGNTGRVTEAPAIVQHDGRTFMSYSTNPCHGPNYKLGMLELTGDNPLQPGDWTKNSTPMLVAANGVYGPGHNGFFTSPDGSEDWLVYHGNALETEGCGNTRSVRVQKFEYDNSGYPSFGEPATPGTLLAPPSGENTPHTLVPEGMAFRIVNTALEHCVVNGESGSLAVTESCSSNSDSWVLDFVGDVYYRLANSRTGEYLQSYSCNTAEAPLAPTASTVVTGNWNNSDCSLWRLAPITNGLLSLTNKHESAKLALDNCDSSADTLGFDNVAEEACSLWQLEPVGEFAITSLQSGKVLQTAGCSNTSGVSIQQWQWNRTACQRFTANPVGNGYFELSSNINTNACLQLTGDVANPGADIIQGACDTETAHWQLDPLSDGSYRIVSRSSGHIIDLDYCLLGDGTNIGQWEWLDNDCQRFTLKPTANAPVADPTTSFLWPLGGDLVTHDPTLEIENTVWYEFQTGEGIQSKTSTNNGLSWSGTGAVLSDDLNWWNTYVPDHANNDVWAPDVQIYNGKAWLYYSISTFGSQTSAIGLLSASSLATGNWVDEGLVISSSPSVNFNAIDPNLFIDTDDEPWLVFGSWWTGIKLTQLDKTTMKPTGDITALATRGGGIEGPSLMYHNGYYYLFVSVGLCCSGVDSTYQIIYGRSANIEGPYLDKNDTAMTNSGGSQLWAGNSRWIGPGGQDIHNNSILNFHAYDAQDNGAPKLNIAELQWDVDGWPYLEE